MSVLYVKSVHHSTQRIRGGSVRGKPSPTKDIGYGKKSSSTFHTIVSFQDLEQLIGRRHLAASFRSLQESSVKAGG
eukprot:scaffold106_cov123-Cylindrotheca_fusiformis.AAC.5